MSFKDIDGDDWSFIILIGFIALIALGFAIVGHWTDLEQNKIITECIKAGKTWKDGNCE